MRKLKLLLLAAVALMGVNVANAQASYNYPYTEGVEVAAGSDLFLYNIGAKRFLDNGMNWGTRATVDNAGKALTLTLDDGKYAINTGVKTRYGGGGGGDYLNGGYTDGAYMTWVFTPVTVAGYTNVYTISDGGGNYFVYQTNAEGDNPACNFTSLSGTNNDYWILVTKAQRQAVKDYTFMLDNTCFNRPWEHKVWTVNITSTGSSGNATPNQSGGKVDNRCAESYRNAFTYLQNATGTVVEGRYKLYNQGFYRMDGGSGAACIYLNEAVEPLKVLNANGENTAQNMDGASTAFSAGQYVNSVEAFVNTGSLTVGIKNDNNMNWVIWNNFYLEYLGQCVMDYAVALPDGGAMAADTWYYFDIAAAADNYTATATTLGDIVCTDDGYTLTSAATGNVALTENDNSLAAKRYYVKSSSENSLVIDVASYSYVVGTATPSIADGAYTNNSLSTFTFTFGEATTNDPDASFALLNGSAKASLKKGGVQQAEGTLSLAGNVLTATFSDVALDLSSTYTIEIAAGVVGYDGQETNAAISTTIKTGTIANGVYYFKRNGTETYLTRGGNYGTENVTDKFGISFEAAIQTDGTYTLKNIDQSLVDNTTKYLNEQYTDQTGAYKWTIESAEGGYVLKKSSGDYVTTSEEGTWHYNYMSNAADKASAIVWTLLSKSEYAAALTARKNAEAAAIATAAGRSETTEAALISALASDFGETDKTSSLTNASLASNADGWTAVSYNGQRRNQAGEEDSKYDVIRFNGGAEVWNYIGGAEQTVSSLPEGIYKVTVKSIWRLADATAATRAGNEANVTAWLYANDNYTQLKSWYDHQLANNAALHASTDDEYVNTLYVYVEDGQDLTIGMASPSWCGVPWMPFYDFTLTYYEPKATPAEKEALADAITAAEAKTLGFEDGEYAPYNNVDALTKLAAAKAIDPETASGEAVVAATSALTGATWTENDGAVNAIYDGNFTNAPVNPATGGVNGWSAAEGLRQLVKSNVEGSIVTTGMYVWGSSAVTYGETTGYTMPLMPNAVYKLTYDRASWSGGSSSHTGITITDPSGTELGVATEDGHAGDWNTTDGTLLSRTIYFATTTAGNYTMTLSPWGNTVYTNMELYKTNDPLEFADGSVPSYVPGTYPSVKITRALTAGKWATAIYPFAVTGVDNIAVLNSYDAETGALGFSTAAGTSVANEPFLMKSASDKSEINLSNVEVAAANATPVVKEPLSLIGTYETKTLAADESYKFYVLSNNAIHPSTGATINPYRAYIQVEQPGEEARALTFFVDGETTGISATLNDNAQKDKVVFNLNGQRVQKAQKGIYIINGKKAIVK